jgi:FtsH-binding integral membrane protein
MRGVAIMVGVALPLAALDLYVKASEPTEPWAYHERSLGWLVLSVFLLAGMVLIARIPSRLVAPAAGVLAAGVLGNGLSAVWNGMEVPNPFVVDADRALIAFNLADVWALTGICLLVLAIGTWLIRNRHLLSPTAAGRSSAVEAFRRRFDEHDG